VAAKSALQKHDVRLGASRPPLLRDRSDSAGRPQQAGIFGASRSATSSSRASFRRS